MAEDGGAPQVERSGVEARLASLEASVAGLTAQVHELRAHDAGHHGMSHWEASPSGVPGRPVEVAPGPPAAPAPANEPPPLGVGWAAYAPGAPKPQAPLSGIPVVWPTRAAQPPGPRTPAHATDAETPPSSGRSWSFAELEERLTGRLLAWVGGAAVLLGAVLFLSLAFSRGWIGPAGRVAIGLLGAIVLFGIGAWLLERRPHQGTVATVLVGVGIGVGTLSVVGATRLYGLVPVDLGLVGSLVLGVAAAIVAIRAESRTVGAFGLLAVLGAPPLLGATPGPVTFALIAMTLVGTTILALRRSWRWFPGLAFALSAPQLASWLVDGAPVTLGLTAVAAFWLIHAIASGGEEILRPRDRLRDSSATLLMADAAYLVWAGFVLLDGPLEVWRGTFLVCVALAHAVLAAACLVRQGDRHPFGLLVAGTGIAALTMAVPVQFHGSVVTIAWTAEATVLAWLSAKRDHLHAGLAALVLGALALGHFVLVEAPIASIGQVAMPATPFLDAAGTTLIFMLGGLAVAAWFLRDIRIRLGLVGAGALLVTYALPFELTGLGLVAGWAVVAVVAVAAERFGLVRLWPDDTRARPAEAGSPLSGLQPGLAALAFVPALLALGHVLVVELPLARLGVGPTPTVPFTDAGAAAAAILVVMSVLMGEAWSRQGQILGALAALSIVTYALPFELAGLALLAGWAALAFLAVAAERFGAVPVLLGDRWRPSWVPVGFDELRPGLGLAGLLPAALAIDHALAIELPLKDLGNAVLPAVPFSDVGAAATLILVAMSLGIGALRGPWSTRAGILVVAGIVAYAATFELPTEWSVMVWAGLAAAGFGAARLDRPSTAIARWAGLGLAGIGVVVALAVIDPPSRLILEGPLKSGPVWGYLAILALAASLVIGARLDMWRSLGPWSLIAAGALIVYLVSIGVVDAFAWRVGGPTATEELAKQAQVVLSVSWTLEGAIIFAVALVRRIGPARQCGLALLALATAKVFLIDLAELDVAYRVLSLVGLGLLLLGSAYAYGRLRPDRATRS